MTPTFAACLLSAALCAASPVPDGPFEQRITEGLAPGVVEEIRFTGPETHAGEGYRWAGREPIEVRVAAARGAHHAVDIRWGAKGDIRSGCVEVNGRPRPVQAGGYDGFDTQTVDVPAAWVDDRGLLIRVRADGAGPAPFLAGLRVRRTAPRAVAPAHATAIAIEAEDLDGPWAEQTNIAGYTGRGFRVSNAAGVAATQLSGTLEIARRGTYAVWVRAYEGNRQDRSFAVSVAGTAFAPTHRDRIAGRWRWCRAGVITLEPGAHALEVRDVGEGHEVVDALLVTDDFDLDPDLGARLEAAAGNGEASRALAARIIEETSSAALEADRAIRALHADPAGREDAVHGLRRRLAAALGLDPLPERTPLNARVVGATARDGYTVERVVFESVPGFPVTANVYVPGGARGARVPAVLCPVGHWHHSKTQPQVQARCIGLAKLGFIALTYDAFGQGERAVPGNSHREYFSTILAGRNNMTAMVWDTVRALDYLLERPDVDSERVACTGASGGGLNTFYAAAIDPRIRAACPVVFVSRVKEFLDTWITHCPCSHVNGLAAFADGGTVLNLIAPRPLLLIAATDDPMFTPEGAREAGLQARGAYAAHGVPERLDVREFPGGHDYSQPMRELLYGWALLHLAGKGDGAPVPEPPMTLEPVDSPVLLCMEGGKVPPSAQTVRSLAHAEATRLVAVLKTAEAAAAADSLARVLAWRAVPPAAPVALEDGLGALHAQVTGAVIMRFSTAAVPAVTCRRVAPAAGPITATLFVARSRQAAGVGDAALRDAGIEVMDIDLAQGGSHEFLAATNSYLLGYPLVARRAAALAAVARTLQARPEAAGRPLVFAAQGLESGLIVLIAQALERPAQAVVLHDVPASLMDAFSAGIDAGASAWRLLHAADIPTLESLCGVPVLRAASAETPSSRAARLRELIGGLAPRAAAPGAR